MFDCRDGAYYIDEIENGLHYSVLKDLWPRMRKWVGDWNVQLVASTHSRECIAASISAFEDSPEELSIHQLYRNEATGRVSAVTYTGDALLGARDLNLRLL